MTKRNNIRFFDMFADIGGFRAGLERAGGFDCISHVVHALALRLKAMHMENMAAARTRKEAA